MSKTRVKLIMVSPDTRQPGSIMRPLRAGAYAVCAMAPPDLASPDHRCRRRGPPCRQRLAVRFLGSIERGERVSRFEKDAPLDNAQWDTYAGQSFCDSKMRWLQPKRGASPCPSAKNACPKSRANSQSSSASLIASKRRGPKGQSNRRRRFPGHRRCYSIWRSRPALAFEGGGFADLSAPRTSPGDCLAQGIRCFAW
jgi:hypothetical protein